MTTIDLPGEPTLFRTFDVPPEQVQLPLRAGPRRGLLLLIALPFAFVGLGGLLLLWAFSTVLETRSLGIADYVTFLVLCPFFLIGLPVAVTCLVDAVRSSPVLVIDAEGFQDSRTSRFVPWCSISRATVKYTRSGSGGVHLKFRAARSARQNPFRPGTLGFVWRRRADELHVPVFLLDVKPRTLAYAVLILVQKNGGEVETRHTVFGMTNDLMPMPRQGDRG